MSFASSRNRESKKGFVIVSHVHLNGSLEVGRNVQEAIISRVNKNVWFGAALKIVSGIWKQSM